MTHTYHYLKEYIPVRYQGLSTQQINDRKDVFNFKDGNTPASVKSGLLSKVWTIIEGNKSDWVICFIPASTKSKTYNRYSSVALYLSHESGCDVYIDAIEKTIDSEAGHVSGKSSDPTANFRINKERIKGKNVILIDDVITRGRTFEDTASKLESTGANKVIGLFVAKTIHPDLPHTDSRNGSHVYFHDEDMFEDYLAEQALEEMAMEEQMIEEQYYEEGCYEDFCEEDIYR